MKLYFTIKPMDIWAIFITYVLLYLSYLCIPKTKIITINRKKNRSFYFWPEGFLYNYSHMLSERLGWVEEKGGSSKYDLS